jgi:hypothetical protein
MNDKGTRAIQSNHRHLVVYDDRLEIFSDVPLIGPKWRGEPRHEIVERHIVVARHNELGKRKHVEKRSRCGEFAAPGALGEIAGYGNQIWIDSSNPMNQRRDDPVVDAAEMQIRNMNNRSHASVCRNEHVQRRRPNSKVEWRG